jgi:hypothetical protein
MRSKTSLCDTTIYSVFFTAWFKQLGFEPVCGACESGFAPFVLSEHSAHSHVKRISLKFQDAAEKPAADHIIEIEEETIRLWRAEDNLEAIVADERQEQPQLAADGIVQADAEHSSESASAFGSGCLR